MFELVWWLAVSEAIPCHVAVLKIIQSVYWSTEISYEYPHTAVMIQDPFLMM